jgi:gliding motility-associated-like protein
MKKSIILLATTLLSLGAMQAAPTYKKCPGESQELKTTNSGDSYQWYKNGNPISGATKNKYTVTNIQEDATYKCVVTTKGGTTDTGNLITLGGFEFPCNNPKTSGTNRLGSNVWYQYLNFDQGGKDIAIGATTTHTNANNVKKQYFCKLKPNTGSYLYVCDGANDSNARVWQAGGIKLPKGKYQFSCHVANIDSAYASHGTNSLAKLKFVIKNDDGEKELLSFTAPSQLGKWEERKATFEATKDYGWCDIYIINFTTEPEGNDFALDDIYFGTEIKDDDTTEEESFNIKLKNCTDTKTIDHPLVTECPNQSVTLTCSKDVPGIKWSNGENNKKSIEVKSNSVVNEGNPDKYSCTYDITENGVTITYTENFSVATKSCTDSNSEEQKVLIGGKVTISSNYAGTPNAKYEWYKIEEDGTKTPVGEGTESITFTAQEGVTYECITTLPDGKVVTETRVVVVYNDIEVTVNICQGKDTTLTAKTANAYSYAWKTPEKEEILSTSQTLPLTEVSSNTKYICTIVSSDESTTITEIYNVVVNPNPELDIKVSATSATINIAKGSAPYTLVLDGDSTSITVNSSTYTLEEIEEGQHIILITDKFKCNSSKSFNVHIPKLEPMIFFSPNNDGLNDLWLVKGIEDAANATVMIYDRYSKLLYKCKGADFKGWDGKYNDRDMVQDDYWYVISVPELDQQISGHFILKR